MIINLTVFLLGSTYYAFFFRCMFLTKEIQIPVDEFRSKIEVLIQA